MARLAHTEYLIEGRTTADVRRHPARDDVRAHRHRQPAGERLPGHRPVRAATAAATTAGSLALIGRDGSGAPPWTPRSSSAPPTSTRTGRLRIGGRRHPGAPLRPRVRGGRDPRQGRGAARRPATPTRPGTGAAGQHRERCVRRWRDAQREPSPGSGWPATGDATVRTRDMLAGQARARRRRRGHLHRDARPPTPFAGPARYGAPLRRAVQHRRLRPRGLGPGPGDPRDTGHPKIAHLRGAVRPAAGASGGRSWRSA